MIAFLRKLFRRRKPQTFYFSAPGRWSVQITRYTRRITPR
jgi:hypothetical protein